MKKPKATDKTGVTMAWALSGIKWAIAICVLAALSSIVFRIYPEEFKSKKRKLAPVKPLIPFFLKLVSKRNPRIWENKPEKI